MGAYRQLIYHLILEPYNREKVFNKFGRNRLFDYIRQVIKNKKCICFAINGVEDHIHLIVYIRPDITISDFVKDIKISSSIFIKREKVFPNFKKWATGYAIFTRPYESLATIIKYVEGQEEHHRNHTFYDEYGALLRKNGL